MPLIIIIFFPLTYFLLRKIAVLILKVKVFRDMNWVGVSCIIALILYVLLILGFSLPSDDYFTNIPVYLMFVGPVILFENYQAKNNSVTRNPIIWFLIVPYITGIVVVWFSAPLLLLFSSNSSAGEALGLWLFMQMFLLPIGLISNSAWILFRVRQIRKQ